MADIAPAPPSIASAVFGDRLELARRYADLLASDGIDHGLMGPRELPRLWVRHLLNSAMVSDAVPESGGERVVDVGSGAGLPGLVIAIRRPDLRVDLVEPMQRRCEFLTRAADALGLTGQVRVVRGRADGRTVREAVGGAPWVTARAVAPLDRLVRWCLPLLEPGGALLAMKGANAAREVAEHRTGLTRLGAGSVEVDTYALPAGAAETLAGDDGVVRIVRVVRAQGDPRIRHVKQGGKVAGGWRRSR